MSSFAGENLLRNADFSQCANPGIPDGWGTGHWGLKEIDSQESLHRFHEDWKLLPNREFQINLGPKGTAPNRLLQSVWTRLPSQNQRYTFSVELYHQSGNGEADIDILNAKSRVIIRKRCKLDETIRRFSVSSELKTDIVAVRIRPLSPGNTRIVRPQLEIGDSPSAFQSASRYKAPLPSAFLQNNHKIKLTFGNLAGASLQDSTEATIWKDSENLYVNFQCDSDLDIRGYEEWKKAKTEFNQLSPEGSDHYVWYAPDSVTILISPYRGGRNYYRLSLDRKGRRFDAEGVDPAWDGHWRSRVAETATGWQAEFILPLAMFPRGQKEWRANFCRENHIRGENGTWSPTYGMFHLVGQLGKLGGLEGTGTPPKVMPPRTATVMKNGSAVVPYGIWCEGDPRKLTTEKLRYFRELSFNSIAVQLPHQITVDEFKTILDKAHRQDLKVLAVFWLHKEDWELYQKSHRPLIITGREHPGLLAWMAMDEPDTWASMDYQRKACDFIRRLDPNHPVYINYTANQRQDGDMPGDIRSMDHYPVPGMDIHSIPTLAARLGNSDKPVWFCLQSSGYAYFSDREPTPVEFKWMTFSSIVRGGVSGFFYFAQMPHTTSLHDAIRQTGHALILLKPFWTGMTITVDLPNLWSLSRLSQGTIYSLTVNPEDIPAETFFKLRGTVQDLFSGETFVADRNGLVKIPFMPRQTRLLNYPEKK